MSPSQHIGEQCNGYALLAVLWVVAGVAMLGLVVSVTGREAVASAQNRANLTRAAWRAEDCLERARVVVARALDNQDSTRDGWSTVDRAIQASQSPLVPACSVTARPTGTTLDMNAADRATLVALFVGMRVERPTADSMADALLDWRDRDDRTRSNGAERDWYVERQRFTPRNGPFADVRELRRVRGFEGWSGARGVLGVETGRVALNHAPLVVLAALPGFTPDAIARIAERRRQGEALEDLAHLFGELSGAARDSFAVNYAQVAERTVVRPDAWILTSRARDGSPAVTAVVEVRLVTAGRRAAIVRRRTWVE